MRSSDKTGRNESQHSLASWDHRLNAFLIDTVIYIVSAVAFLIVRGVLDSNARPARTSGETRYDGFYYMATTNLYFTMLFLIIWGGLLEGTWGLTPGKAALGLRVLSAKNHTQFIGFKRGIARELIRSSPIMIYCLVILSGLEISDQLAVFFMVLFLLSVPVLVLDHLWLLWDKERQTLHDKIAKSHVVSKEPGIIDRYPYS